MRIHPTVILNISEHHTRALVNNKTNGSVVGALLGKNDTIVDSFEIVHDDFEFYLKKRDLVKQVTQDLDVIGIYSTGSVESAFNLFHERILLLLNPYKRDGYLPINVYVRNNDEFVEVDWTIVSDDVEVIGLEHAKGADAPLHPQRMALKRLKQRIKILSKFVKDVQSGIIPLTPQVCSIIKDIAKLTNGSDRQQYSKVFNVQCNDVALQTYLGIMIKGCDVINQSKLNKQTAKKVAPARDMLSNSQLQFGS